MWSGIHIQDESVSAGSRLARARLGHGEHWGSWYRKQEQVRETDE